MTRQNNKIQGGYNDELNVSAEDILGNVYVWKYKLEMITGIKNSSGGDTERYYYRIISEKRK